MTDDTAIFDPQDATGQRRQHIAAKACLHCYVWEAINAYYRDAKQTDPATGELMYDPREILGHLGDILAECIAGIPDRKQRRQMVAELDRHVRKKTADYIASGNHPASKKVALQ